MVRSCAVCGYAGHHPVSIGFLVGLRFPASGKRTVSFSDYVRHALTHLLFSLLDMNLILATLQGWL